MEGVWKKKTRNKQISTKNKVNAWLWNDCGRKRPEVREIP